MKIIQLNNYVKPVIEEVKNKDWVLNGKNNDYFDYVKYRYIGSPTNAAIIDTYRSLTFGKGLAAKNASRKPLEWVKLLSILDKKDLKKVVEEFLLQGNAAFQVIQNKQGNEPAKIKHIPVKTLAPQKANEDGEVEGYWYCTSWKDYRKAEFEPQYFEKWTPDTKAAISIVYINDCESDINYYSLPKYQSGLQYAEMEEEVSNYYINHIKNGFSFGYVVNMNNGIPATEEDRYEIEQRIKNQLTGSSNAGKMVISFNNGKEAEITIVPIVGNSSHKQWETVNKEAEEKLMRSHRVVSPMLFGIKNNTGLGNNADELDTALKLTMDMVINPIQYFILDFIDPVLQAAGVNLDLYFKPINEQEQQEQAEEPQQAVTELSETEPNPSQFLIDLGEEEPNADEWELITEETIKGRPLQDAALQLAALPSTPRNKSDQDNDLFKVRYVYAGNKTGQRQFCKDMLAAKKVYRFEDIDAAKNKIVQAGMGPNGADTYDVWLWKGGVNCKHFWERRVYLRKNNKRISVNEARRRILDLDPSDRAEFRLPENDKKVAKRPHDMPRGGRLPK
ncbi:phage portal protein [Nonlabens phage P12024L]|uniref:Phage portal protein n=1 Tax=Nonlabens phage P12024L TaxID=1168479 RepID=I6R154_9CAUD|nr:portal protein [Nonlabens phage P12024L]AFM54726.1 phage portal protein [Nonlabens phage P12024L]